ncbi:MAG: tRNA (adenosine(37)-N6)-dimethylallyltransferase MiaA [Oscillatoriales cyanobacterium]|nr:MAG: tRNA (adenosine(37)-N6)-dimethylallyltransferase MiaA [Oscillatoriales cyanobacterium]
MVDLNNNSLTFFSPRLITIVGPTAAGKSSLAIALAQYLQSVILGADSRQIYKHFTIGTAKPSLVDRAAAVHELIDICEPTENFTVSEFQAQAFNRIQYWHTQCTIPLLVGGTGLYIKSIVRGLKIPQVPAQTELRQQLFNLDRDYRYQLLQQVDPKSAGIIHPNDDTRITRALEVFYATGQGISTLQGELPPPYPVLQIGIDCLDQAPINMKQSAQQQVQNHTDFKVRQASLSDRLSCRIQQRTSSMFMNGFVDEVSSLLQTYGSELPLFQTLGYREVSDALQGKITIAEAERLTALHTRQFAKRQRTWFRADPTIQWLDADDPQLLKQAKNLVDQFLTLSSMNHD